MVSFIMTSNASRAHSDHTHPTALAHSPPLPSPSPLPNQPIFYQGGSLALLTGAWAK